MPFELEPIAHSPWSRPGDQFIGDYLVAKAAWLPHWPVPVGSRVYIWPGKQRNISAAALGEPLPALTPRGVPRATHLGFPSLCHEQVTQS